ncbi:MAG: biopolymer transporter Tol, partial [Povalibacter sp.]
MKTNKHFISALLLIAFGGLVHAADAPTPEVPEWAQPGSATRQQVAPPADFTRPTTNFATPIGMFEGQSD